MTADDYRPEPPIHTGPLRLTHQQVDALTALIESLRPGWSSEDVEAWLTERADYRHDRLAVLALGLALLSTLDGPHAIPDKAFALMDHVAEQFEALSDRCRNHPYRLAVACPECRARRAAGMPQEARDILARAGITTERNRP